MPRKLPGSAPVATTHQIPAEAEIGKLREEWASFVNFNDRLADERQRWFDDQQQRVDDLVIRALWKRLGPVFASFLVFAFATGGFYWWRLEGKARELMQKSEQTAALNDSLRLALRQTRDSLFLTLDYSRGQMDLQNRLYGDALGAYRDGFLTTLLQNAELKGQVSGQMALAEQSISRADRASSRLDSTRASILSINDSIALQYQGLDTAVTQIRSRVDSLGPQRDLARWWGFP